MGFVQLNNRQSGKRGVTTARIRIRGDALGAITTSAIDSLVAKVTQQPAPAPTSTGANIYTTTSGGGSLAPSAPIAPPSSPPIVYTAPVQPAPAPSAPMAPITPPTTFTPPTTYTPPTPDQPPPPSGGSSSSGGGSPTPYTGASVDVTPPSSGFLPESETPPASAPAPTLVDKIAALPVGVKVSAALALAYFLFKRR